MASKKASLNLINGSKSHSKNISSPGHKVGTKRSSWLFWLSIIMVLLLSPLVYFRSQTDAKRYHPQPMQRFSKIVTNISSTRTWSSTPKQVINSTYNQTKVPLSTSKPAPQVTPQVANPTSAKDSFFYIRNPKESYSLCDQLELYIEARDGQNKTKTRGGDHMWPFLTTTSLRASAPVDEFTDHGNGTYTARFTLHWTGEITPIVRLAFSAELADFQRSMREHAPLRYAYDAMFTDGNGTNELTPCHIDRDIFVDKRAAGLSLSPTKEVCDFSNRTAGTTWYCLKPKTLSCSNFTLHRGNLRRGMKYVNMKARPGEMRLLTSAAALKNTGDMKNLTVKSNVSDASCMDLPSCHFGLPPKHPHHAAGYYFKDSWKSKVCRARGFQKNDILKCLSNKNLYFYGDSTIRQWFEYLAEELSDTMEEEPMIGKGAARVGPRRARDSKHNITMFFRLHGYPIRSAWVDVTNIKLTVTEIDDLEGGEDTVVAFTLWAHFTPTNLSYFRSRLEHIKDAITRLQKRGAGTSPIFFKSANTRNSVSLETSDLYAYDLDQTMRAVFADVPGVFIVDVWDMTLSHRSGYRIHPVREVIKEEVKMFLNLLCN